MYKVIKTKGDYEAWWFLENWQEDIVEEKSFTSFDTALSYYSLEWEALKVTYPNYHSKKNLLATFWTKDEMRWCELCAEPLQQFHSILLLKNDDILSDDECIDDFEQECKED